MSEVKQKDWAVFRRIMGAYRPYLLIFIIGVIATVVMSMVDSAFALSLKYIIDNGVVHPNAKFLMWLPLGVVILSLLRTGASVTSRYNMNRAAQSVVRDYRRDIFSKLLTLPSRYYDHHTSGHILSTLLYNTGQIVQAGVDVLVYIFQDGTATIGLLAAMCIASWRLFLMVLFFVLPIVAVARWGSRKMRGTSRKVQALMGDVTHIAEEGIKNYKMIRIYGGQSYENKKFRDRTDENLRRQLKVILINSLSSGSMQIFIAIPLAAIFFFFKPLLLHITAGSLVAFISSMGMLVKPVRRVVGLNSQVQQGFAGAEGVFEILDQDSEEDTGTQHLERATGHVRYRDVNFKYFQSEKNALDNVSFEIRPGQTVALVGRSGSGKSTIASLLPRFYDPQSGAVEIDEVNVRDYQLKDLRDQFALVSQDVTLFNDTIAANIAYGSSSDATEAQIIAAAESANAMEFINELPEGINTLVGENGVRLSGGQRQRLAIARALLKSAPILILDEATSALDTETEKRIQAALDGLMQTCTSLVIAHRLSTIENADWIVVIDDGRVAEQGTHESLMTANAIYAALYRMQFKEPQPIADKAAADAETAVEPA